MSCDGSRSTRCTHAVHFGSAPWLREHLGGLAAELLDGTATGLSAGRSARPRARRRGDRSATAARRSSASSDPLALLAPPESRGD